MHPPQDPTSLLDVQISHNEIINKALLFRMNIWFAMETRSDRALKSNEQTPFRNIPIRLSEGLEPFLIDRATYPLIEDTPVKLRGDTRRILNLPSQLYEL